MARLTENRRARVACCVGGAILLTAALGCRTPRPVPLPAATSEPAVQARILPVAFETADTPPIRPATPELSDPLTLPAAIAYGLTHNPRLRELAARIDAARAGETIAFAPFLPEFGTSARYSAFTEPVIPGGAYVPASIAGGANSYSIAEAGTQWTLYDFGRTAGRYGQAVSQTRIAELQRTRGQQVVAFDVARSYFTLLQAHAVARVFGQALKQAEAILEDTRARREGGVADREAVLRAEVEVSHARERVVAAEQQVHDAEAGLNLALGRPTGAPLRLAEPPHPLLVQPQLEECLMTAATQRPEIGAAREAVAEAAYGVEAARGQLKPRIFVRGTILRADSPGPVEGWLAGAGVHFEQKLYVGGQHRAEVRRQQAQVSAAVAALEAILDNIGHQVHLAHQAIATQEARIRLGQTARAQADENLRLTLVKFNNGDATPTDVVDAQTALVRAAVLYQSAVYDYLEALARLDYAQGGDQSRLMEFLAAESDATPVQLGPPRTAPPALPEVDEPDR